MSLFTPGRRWQPPFFPFKKEPFGKRVLRKTERYIKGPMFGCRMCGNCLLQETAFICPMECPKGMRNGPCGGSTKEKCYVDESRPCIWYKIYAGDSPDFVCDETNLVDTVTNLNYNYTLTGEEKKFFKIVVSDQP